MYYGAAAVEAPNCRDQDVYVVGGANSAGQAAVFLARQARTVTLLVRDRRLESSMSHYLIQQLRDIDTVKVRTGMTVVGAKVDHLEQIEVRDETTGLTEVLPTSWLFIFIGAAPLTDWLDGVVARDARGLRPGRPRPSRRRSASTRLGAGTRSVALGDERPRRLRGRRRALRFGQASGVAVGEGAMAVTLVHRYLERL